MLDMSELTVPEYKRPSPWKYVWYTAIGFAIVGSLAGLLTQNASSGVVALGAVIAAAILNLGILFLMVQSLIEEWFEAAEVYEP